MPSISAAAANLVSVPVLVFLLGFAAARVRSDLRLPEPVYQLLSVFLLFGIGLKGGHALKATPLDAFVVPAVATLALGVLVPLLAFVALRSVHTIGDLDRGAIAAHYGSTSLVTFSAALLFLEAHEIRVEGFAAALLTIMEIPGIVVGIYLGARHRRRGVPWATTLHEVLTGRTILLLVGGLAVGALVSDDGYGRVAPLFVDLQPGVLSLFLLHLGSVAGSNWEQIRHVGGRIALFALLFPPLAATVGIVVGGAAGLSIGGAVVLGVLCASASYIAAPAAVAVALPEANASLALVASIGVTFPFNLLVGIALYAEIARRIAGG